jgi:large subunit ribosomal protein L18
MSKLRIPKRRRRQNKTDYKARLCLLKSEDPRIVIRITNKYFILQSVESKRAKDAVKLTLTSKELLKQGLDKKYSGSLKSLPAGYLTGLLFAKKLDKSQYIIDLGMIRNVSGSRVYAVLNGLYDGGAKIKVNKEVFPSKERINGEHLNEDTKKAFNKLLEKLS